MRFFLMNKDRAWLEFACEINEFEEVLLEECQWYTAQRPFGYRSLSGFLESRKAPKHRAHIAKLLRQYGCDRLDSYLILTHALSLNDTFWVKETSSALSWAEVSLYRNPFNEVIANAAFDGSCSSTLSSTSPEFSTDGQYAKCWVREEGMIRLCKTGGLFGLEPLSEYLASQLARVVCPQSIPYDLDFYHGQLVSVCDLFTDEKTGLAKAGAVTKERTVAGLLRFFEEIGSGEDFRRMCILDALILNVDRHMGNFGVLYDNDTLEIQGMAPVFDNNRSLLFDLDEDQMKNREWSLRHCTPRLGTDFIATAKGILTEPLREELEALRDFSFRQHPRISAPQERLDRLTEIVRYQLERILE